MAIAAPRRRADGDKHSLGTHQGLRQFPGEAKPSGLDVFRHQCVQPRLINRHAAFPQRRELMRVGLDNGDL